MPASAVLGFALVAFTLIMVPGPDWAYILAAAVRDRVVLPAVGGLLLGYAAVTLVVSAGVGSLVAGSSTALLVLTVGGAAYLVHLGTKALRSRAEIGHGGPEMVAGASPLRYVVRGAGVSALNPKGLLLFLSVLPQFTRPSAGWPVAVQLATLGAVFIAACATFYFPLGYASDRVLGARPGAARATTRIAGVAMVVVGLALLAERVVETFG
ncbi:LysE family translocator [Nocardioides sp. CER19]|uniref:LysE family translocator n=1 Tax=Nocardioides sp. CER19 TaxID=3038538 RepID=UPI0024491852|nr:LysE family translocator [Nocardioides sp. CER19]MDH2415832.1 LysE family translocator [Nocardioides sp. CER19]